MKILYFQFLYIFSIISFLCRLFLSHGLYVEFINGSNSSYQ